MKKTLAKREQTQRLALAALMTALVIVIQTLATVTTFFGPFSTAIGLIPIVIGGALCGVGVGSWLGLVFGVVVLATGGAALFLGFNPVGTYITVLAKGLACGFAAAISYKLLNKINNILSIVTAALLCPVVNTGVFLLGCRLFFYKYALDIGTVVGLGADVNGMDVFFALAMANFAFEIAMNLVLSPVIVRLIDIAKKQFAGKSVKK